MSKEDDKRLSYKNTRFVELKKYWIRWLVKWRPNLFNEDRKVYVEFIYVLHRFCRCLPIHASLVLHQDRCGDFSRDKININHSSAGRSGAWIITVALTISFSSLLITHPFHFGAYKFHGRKLAS